MADNDMHLVVGRGTTTDDRPVVRVEGSSGEDVLAQLATIDDDSRVIAAVDNAVADLDEFVALVSVLVLRGVQVFETRWPQAVQRILDTHLAIVSTEIEVLET